MTLYWSGDGISLYHGDCVAVMAEMAEASVDAIVCDPPYELAFMSKRWDATGVAFDPVTWAAALRVLKPGGHLLAFGGTRTSHRVACAIEDAGFEIRDSIAWLYGSGFPKSLDVSKAIDKAAGAEREVIGPSARHVSGKPEQRTVGMNGSITFQETIGMGGTLTAPATDAARQWEGWGTALKPAYENITMARKPFRGTVAANVLEHGTGALNIDGCRIGTGERVNNAGGSSSINRVSRVEQGYRPTTGEWATGEATTVVGRWPANVALDESQAAALDEQSGISKSIRSMRGDGIGVGYHGSENPHDTERGFADTGGASRYFFVAQPDEQLEARFKYTAKAPTSERPSQGGIQHATVKPLSLMQWLVRLVTPPKGVVLDPFAGSGTTGEAAIREGFTTILIEQEADYLPLILERFRRPINHILDFGDAS